jgi:hypothetical protein
LKKSFKKCYALYNGEKISLALKFAIYSKMKIKNINKIGK